MAGTPKEVALLEAFLNTIDLERFGAKASKPEQERDVINRPKLLKQWLVDRALLRRGSRITRGDVEDARRLRDGLRAMLRASQGLTFDRAALEDAQGLAARSSVFVALSESSGPALHPGSGGVQGAFERIVADVATASATDKLTRLKVCSAEDCQLVFYDHSRSRTKRWCAMETCGNRVKTRRYRRRHQHEG
ncbi:MAG: CGNR zinc finger domain-containing protein [Actinomycetota bacterium]